MFGRSASKKTEVLLRQRVKKEGLRRLEPWARRARAVLIGALIMSTCVGLSFLCAVTGKMLHFFLLESEYFRLSDVRTEGVTADVRDELLALTGLSSTRGVNLLTLDAERVRVAALRHPKLRGARVTKNYPDGVTIEGDQREPAAILSSDGFHAVDDEAVVLGPIDLRGVDDDKPLPFITGIPEAAIAAGQRVEDPQLAHALDFLAAVRAVNPSLYRRLSEIHLSDDEGLIVYLVGGLEARLGRGACFDKLPALERFLQEYPDTRTTEYVDLRFDERIVYRPRESASQ